METTHKLMSEGLINKILFLQKHKEKLSEWELNLLHDRTEALSKYKTRAVATQKQVYQLGQIFKKVKIEGKITRSLTGS